MKKQFILFLVLLFVIFSCKKADQSIEKEISATIMNTGSVAADGCGFLIKIDASGTSYHADNLPEAYQKDNLPVVINYHALTTKFQCGMIASNLLPVISIDAIQNK